MDNEKNEKSKKNLEYIRDYTEATYVRKTIRIRKDSELAEQLEKYQKDGGSVNGLVVELLEKYFE